MNGNVLILQCLNPLYQLIAAIQKENKTVKQNEPKVTAALLGVVIYCIYKRHLKTDLTD